MKHLSLLITLLLLGLSTAIAPKVSAESSTGVKNCSNSISGLILNLGCNTPEKIKEKLCPLKEQNYQLGRVYLRGSLPNDIRFIQLENGTNFWTNKGSGDVGDGVLVIGIEGQDPKVIERFQPPWINKLSGLKLPDKNIGKIIEQYLMQKGITESVKSFCS